MDCVRIDSNAIDVGCVIYLKPVLQIAGVFVGSHYVATHYVIVKFPYVGFMSAKSHS